VVSRPCHVWGAAAGDAPRALLDHVVVPIASDGDATATCAALGPYLDEIERITAVHVIEKGDGSVDKAPMETRRSDGAEFLAIVDARIAGDVALDTRIEFGTDVVETLFEAAIEVGATSIGVRHRGGSRIVQILAGDTGRKLVTDPKVPVVSLPTPREG
jgi:nucleotide-binding universal stress UspA family protein